MVDLQSRDQNLSLSTLRARVLNKSTDYTADLFELHEAHRRNLGLTSEWFSGFVDLPPLPFVHPPLPYFVAT